MYPAPPVTSTASLGMRAAALRRRAGRCQSDRRRGLVLAEEAIEIEDGFHQAVLERDLGSPAETLACHADIGTALARIVRGQRVEHDARARAGHLDHQLRERGDG